MTKVINDMRRDRIYIGIIITLIFLYSLRTYQSKLTRDDYDQQINSADQSIRDLGDSIQSLNNSINLNQNSIDSLKSIKNKRIKEYVTNNQKAFLLDSLVSSYDVKQLEEFFTNRYNQANEN